eukprot:TRINITY_DN41352_c0_g1_i1.p1 TRINITY_DN41352_c0_g1~~TRINITY_DN41352_c0_g1_i1.p1  ORF type:complete len:257 (+),score=48.37 TRINITY_DN41352_c0_g1_i1:52-822(+)
MAWLAGLVAVAAAGAADDEEATLIPAAFSLGCFWHAKNAFLEMPGVEAVRIGFMGEGEGVPDQDLLAANRDTGWFEAIQLFYDPGVTTYPKLLERFFASHSPWEKGGQGRMRGNQFGSVIWFHTEHQAKLARRTIQKFKGDPPENWKKHGPYLTDVRPATPFHPALRSDGSAAQYHCHGHRPDWAASAKSYQHRVSNVDLPDGWAQEVERTKVQVARSLALRQTAERRRTLREYFKMEAQKRLAGKGGGGSGGEAM